MGNVASSNGYSEFKFLTIISSWSDSDGLPPTAFFSLEMVDNQATSWMSTLYSSWVFYVAWYGPLCAIFGKFVMVLGVVSMASNEVIDSVLGIAFSFTKRGADSIVNYLMHMLVVYSAAIAGLFNDFTFLRWIVGIVLSVVCAQFWMWQPVASAVKFALIFPPARRWF